MKTVFEIVKGYLIENKYDGLYNDLCGDECGCGIDDLMPCDYDCISKCTPAYKHECEKCEVEECEYRDDNFGCYKPEQQKEKQP